MRVGLVDSQYTVCHIATMRVGLVDSQYTVCHIATMRVGLVDSQYTVCHIATMRVGLVDSQYTVCHIATMRVGLVDSQYTVCHIATMRVGPVDSQYTVCHIATMSVGVVDSQYTVCHIATMRVGVVDSQYTVCHIATMKVGVVDSQYTVCHIATMKHGLDYEMTTSLKSEFSLSKFGLGHQHPALFISSQWRCSRCMYVLWRIFWFLWNLGWNIASPVVMSIYDVRTAAEGAKWFIYLTNTTLLLTTLTCALDAVVVCYLTFTRRGREIIDSWTQDGHVASSPPLKEDILFQGQFILISGFQQCTTPWYMKLTWLLYNIIGSSNILVTIMYWAVVYDGSTDVIQVVINTINTVFVISNICVTAMPCQLFHFIYPVVYGALYFIFTYIYFVAGGTNIQSLDVIYNALDWHKAHPTVVGVVIGVVVCVPIAHLLLFALYTFRLFVYSKLNSQTFELSSNLKTKNNIVMNVETNNTTNKFEEINNVINDEIIRIMLRSEGIKWKSRMRAVMTEV
ncbi:hypothetical protein Btru_054868 [Bulinus truncatus]|nr:hypothetical protein Btru_054868 [Bulinus truncatus]